MILGKAVRSQNGIPVRFRRENSKPNGLLLKGVVTATYVVDSTDHPKYDDSINTPIAIYCDVVVYTNIAYTRWFPLSKVLVSQKRGGLHNDDIWKPRAVSKNIFGDFNSTTGANPGSLDGDHVLIGFINNSFDEPIILKGLPHPSRDVNNDPYEVGKRIKLKVIDGDPDFTKHHGVFYGVSDVGDFEVNTIYGNDGTTDDNGIEPNPSNNGNSGNQNYNLPKGSAFSIIFKDTTNPISPTEYMKFKVQSSDDNIEVTMDGGKVITISKSELQAFLKLGNGAVSAAISEYLEVLYNKVYLALFTHIHPIGTPNTGTPIWGSPEGLPTWDSNIKSEKLTFPDN